MPFKMFTETGSKNKEFISITSNKTFGLSRNFLNTHHINTNHKVVLYYDAEEKKIAFYFSMFEKKNGLNIRIPLPRYGGTIVAKSFFDLQKIDVSIYGGRYDDIEEIQPSVLGADDVGGDAFVIQLKENPVAKVKDKASGNQVTNPWEDINDKPIDLSEIPF